MPEADLIPGLDTTALTEVSGAQLYSLIRDALPEDNRGGVIYSATTPDVVTNPHLVRYIWVDLNGKNADSQPPFVARVWNTVTSGWDPLTIALATVTGDDIEDGSIDPVAKLSAEGLADGLILMTNADDWQVISLLDAIASGSLPLSKLVAGSAGQYLYDDGTVRLWRNIQFGDITVADGEVNTTKLSIPPDETYILGGDPSDGLKPKWRAFSSVVTRALILTLFGTNRFPWSHIGKGGADQVPVMDSEGTDWTFLDRSSLGSVVKEEYTRNLNTFVTTDSEYWNQAHTLAAVPALMQLSLRCVDATNPHGYDVNDEINISTFTTLGADDFIPIGLTVNETDFTVIGYQVLNNLYVMDKSTTPNFRGFLLHEYQYWEIVVRVIKITA